MEKRIEKKLISWDKAIELLDAGQEVLIEKKDGELIIAKEDTFFKLRTLYGAKFYTEQEIIVLSTKEYESLQEDREFLSCLEACGVDNWNGYSDACDMMQAEEEDY
jgi:hypothetical protein